MPLGGGGEMVAFACKTMLQQINPSTTSSLSRGGKGEKRIQAREFVTEKGECLIEVTTLQRLQNIQHCQKEP